MNRRVRCHVTAYFLATSTPDVPSMSATVAPCARGEASSQSRLALSLAVYRSGTRLEDDTSTHERLRHVLVALRARLPTLHELYVLCEAFPLRLAHPLERDQATYKHACRRDGADEH